MYLIHSGFKEFNETIYKIDFLEKYFWISSQFNDFKIYSSDNGEFVTQIDQELIPNIQRNSIKVIGDFLYCLGGKDSILVN